MRHAIYTISCFCRKRNYVCEEFRIIFFKDEGLILNRLVRVKIRTRKLVCVTKLVTNPSHYYFK